MGAVWTESYGTSLKEDGISSQDPTPWCLLRHHRPQMWEHLGPNLKWPECWAESRKALPDSTAHPCCGCSPVADLSSSLESVCPVAMVTNCHKAGPTNISFIVRGLKAKPSWAPSESWRERVTSSRARFQCSWLHQHPSSLPS